MGREASLRLNITVSTGAGTGTLTKSWELVRWLRIIPTTENDTYTLTIKDADGHIMLNRTNVLGTFAEKVELSMGIMNTIEIASASADGTYIAKLDTH